MPLPNPFSGWPTFAFSLQQWGDLLLQPLAPVALTTFTAADPARRRFVGTLGAAANLDAALPAGSDVGVQVSGTGNVLASPPTLGAEIRWNSRNAAPGLAGLSVRGEVGLEQTVLAGPGTTARPVLFFELLPDAAAGQAQSVTLGVQATQGASSTTLVLLSSAVASPGPVRMRVGVATGVATALPAKNVAAGGATTSTAFLDDGGAASLTGGPSESVAAVELTIADPAGGEVHLPGQLRVEVDVPSDPSSGPTVKVSGADGLDLDVALILRDASGELRASVAVPTLPPLLQVAVTPGAASTAIAWSTGTAAAPRSLRQPELAASVDLTPSAGDRVQLAATLTDLPPAIDIAVSDASVSVHGRDGTTPSAIAALTGTLITGAQVPPALTDFVWVDALAASAAAHLQHVHSVDVGWATGDPITAGLGFAARHPLSGFVTAAGLRANATIDALPLEVDLSVETATGQVRWTASDPVDALALDATIVTTDPATGDGTGIIRVAGEIDEIPAALTAAIAADDVHLTFTPDAPSRVAATVELAPPDGWVVGEAPPALPSFDRHVEAELSGLPDALQLHATPSLAELTAGPAQLDWQGSADLDYAVVALDGFALGPVRHVRARVGELPPRLSVDLDLVGLTFDVRATNQGRIGAIHVQAGDEPVDAGAGAAPRRLDADVDLRAGHVAVDGTVRGLERAQMRALPIGTGASRLDAEVRFGAPGAFPGGFTASGPQLRARVRTDELEGTADARSFPDLLSADVDLDALQFDLRLPLFDLDVDATGSIEVLGTTYAFDADVRAPIVPNHLKVAVTRDEATGELTEIDYEAAARFEDLLLELEATPAPALGMQHARALVDLPPAMQLDLTSLRLDAVGGIDAFVRVRSSVDVPLPTTIRTGQIVRVVTVPEAPSADSLSLGQFGFVEAACAKVRAFEGFRTQGVGPAGGLRPLRGPRLRFARPGEQERVFASIQRRLGRNRLLRLAQANLGFVRPEQIDLLLTPGSLGEVGVDFGAPLRTNAGTTLGNFVVRLEHPYVGTPGGPPVGERDPAFVVPGLQIAGIGSLRGTIAAVPARLEVAVTSLGPFGSVATPLTVSGSGQSIGIPSGWGGSRVDLRLDGNLAVRDISATLYGLDWRREQRWQRITAGRVDIQPTGRTDGRTSAPRTVTLHQFGLEPTVGNGGDTGTGIALTIPSNCPTNVAAVVSSAAFVRPATATAPSGPTGAFGSPVQVDVGRLSGFLGVRVGPGLLQQLPTVAESVGSASQWRIVAATPIGAAFLGNTAIVPLSLIEHIGIAAAAILIGDLFLGPIGWWLGLGVGILEVKYFTALEAPLLAPRPAAND